VRSGVRTSICAEIAAREKIGPQVNKLEV